MEKKDTQSLPIVSFIIVYHNEDIDVLCRCIDSVLALSLSRSERELIIVDDGSDYSPMNELLRYGDDIIYVRKPHGGKSTARNLGISVSVGNYIQFVDAADSLVPSAYERCLDVVRYNSPDAVLFDICQSLQANDVNLSEPLGPVGGAEYMRHTNLRARASGYVFSRAILHDLRFTPYIINEDEEFTPQLILRCERLFHLGVKAYCISEQGTKLSPSNDIKFNLRTLDDAEQVIMRLFRLSERLPHADRIALRRKVDQLTMDYLLNTIYTTRSLKNLRERISRLEPLGLFPLPDRSYTKRYSLYRRMLNNSIGQRLLIVAPQFGRFAV